MSNRFVKGLVFALNSSGRFSYKDPQDVVDFLIVGAGIVGLATAQRISQRFPHKSVYLVEAHARAGEETSSRNSEVIHAGLFYPPSFLKTRLCLRGRELSYDRCRAYSIPFLNTGKLVVAHQHQLPYIESLHAKSKLMTWPPHSDVRKVESPVLPTELLSGSQARELEPDLSPHIAGALLVPVTGILDSHALMNSLEKDIMESENAALVFNTSVVRVDPYVPPTNDNTSVGWVVQMQTRSAAGQATSNDPSTDALLARTVITSTGLSGPHILNSILPPSDRIPAFYARGSYVSYRGPGVGNVKRLIYPCPDEHIQSLGTHLTLDLGGNVRFGPDLEYIEPPAQSSNSEESLDPDFWQAFLSPSTERIHGMHAAITSYLPNVTLSGLQPDYVGIRPKLVGKDGGLVDFMVRCCYADSKGRSRSTREEGLLISLLGIESPGLTSSLAIAEMIVEDILKNST